MATRVTNPIMDRKKRTILYEYIEKKSLKRGKLIPK